jgi:hypothetical protein
VLEVAIAKGGYRKGFRVVMYIEQWTIAQRALGHEPTVEEAAAWWKEPRRTWFHRQAEFREIFDLAETPAPIAAAAIAAADEWVERRGSVVSVLGSLPVPAAVAAA